MKRIVSTCAFALFLSAGIIGCGSAASTGGGGGGAPPKTGTPTAGPGKDSKETPGKEMPSKDGKDNKK